jgi:hypothetical protein
LNFIRFGFVTCQKVFFTLMDTFLWQALFATKQDLEISVINLQISLIYLQISLNSCGYLQIFKDISKCL